MGKMRLADPLLNTLQIFVTFQVFSSDYSNHQRNIIVQDRLLNYLARSSAIAFFQAR